MTQQPTGWGGARQGTPGRAYPQRSDLNQVRAPAAGQSTGAPPPQRPGFVTPDETPSLGDPSADNRPVTDGVPIGPGRGATALAPTPDISNDRTIMALRVLYQHTGSPHLLRLMSQAQQMRVLGGDGL